MKKGKRKEVVNSNLAELQRLSERARQGGEREGYLWLSPGNGQIKVTKNFEKFEGLSGKATIILTAIEPLHIGSGLIVRKNGQLAQALQRLRHGRIVIPGSSIKGVIKHYMRIYLTEDVINKIFGPADGASKCQFSDAVPISEEIKTEIRNIKERYGPRLCPQVIKEGIKFYFNSSEVTSGKPLRDGETLEIIPANSKFKFEINFRNMSEEELGALFLSMGMEKDNEHGLKIGGAKSQGLGLVKFEVDEKESWYFPSSEKIIEKGEVINKSKINEWIKVFSEKSGGEKEDIKKIKEWLKDEYNINPGKESIK